VTPPISRQEPDEKSKSSGAAVAGGFLKLHVRGDRADRLFGLTHPEPIESIRQALLDARRWGRVAW